jgi:hypothetical protein
MQRAIEDAAPSLRDLAGAVSVPYDTFRAWSIGRRNPGPDHLKAFADVLEQRASRLREHAEELRTAAAAEGDAE